MNKKITSIIVIIITLSLVLIYTLASTYAVIINVKQESGINEIINIITIRELVTNDDGTYNKTYYDIKNELNITEEEGNYIIESKKLNDNLQIALKNIVEYKLNNKPKLTNDELYNLIVDGVNNTNTLSENLKNKIINKSNKYIHDIYTYIYDIDIEVIS